MTLAYVGIGSNLGGAEAQVKRALDEIAALPGSQLNAHSSLYRSAPIGHRAQPDFVNAVAALDTALGARQLLAALQNIEIRHGRERSFRNAPRTLDLDLLLYGEQRIDEPGLVVPHPRMHERAFVLIPLTEIAPRAEIPGRGGAADCLRACPDQRVEKIA